MALRRCLIHTFGFRSTLRFCKRRSFILVMLLVLVFGSCSKEIQKSFGDIPLGVGTLSNELKIFHDISSLPHYLENVYDGQVSTYDTTWKNNDGFNGTYSFLRRNADSSLVIFDVEGSGVINRIWTPTPTEDTLDFYIDADHPTFSIKYRDLFSGKKFPFVAPLCGNQLGGFYCYVPITFEKSCRIVSRGKRMQFHQIQYRLYPEGTKVKSFLMELSAEEKTAFQKIERLWNKDEKSIRDFYAGEMIESHKEITIKPNQTITAFETRHGGRILGIEIEPVHVFEGLTKNIDIRITWDNEMRPAVFCPVADFFGFAFGSSSMQSLLLGTQDNKNYCYFPMPFDDAAKIEFVYRDDNSTQSPLTISVKVWHSSQSRIKEREGKFYARWTNDHPVKGTQHVFLNVNGKGHYVGTVLQSQGLKSGMTIFFEGDDSTAIDGGFRMHGTGSEDYFNGGWYAMLDRWDGRMSLPLHGSLDYSLPFARTGGYRLFLSDKISFSKNFYHGIEHGPVGNAFPVEYTSIGLYYADQPPASVIEPKSENTQFFLPDTLVIYPQLMDYNVFGNLDIKTTWKFGTGGESYFFTAGNDTWLRISLNEIPDASYRLLLDIQKTPEGCDFSLWQRQSPLSKWISTYDTDGARAKDLFIADLEVKEFKKTVTIRFKTDGLKKTLLLHRLILVKK
jgi:hypothetical protein